MSPLVEADEKILCILKWLLEKSYTQSIFVYLNFTSNPHKNDFYRFPRDSFERNLKRESI